MARPLPNTNKLDFRKNRNSEPEAPKTPMPDGMKKHEDCCRRQAEKSVLAIITKSPPARKSQTIKIVLLADPLSLVHQVFLHVTNERNRPAKANAAQLQEIQAEFCKRHLWLRFSFACHNCL